MRKRHGNEMRWFEIIGQEISPRKIKSYFFKERIKQFLVGTIHEGCEKGICHFFPKVFLL